MTDQEIEDYVREYAPEMDPQEVIDFMAEHGKPEGEFDSHVGWATKLLRERGEGQFADGPPIEKVTSAMRQHDARKE
jgi:hypothetical protein